MKIDKQQQEAILSAINDLLSKQNVSATIYLFGGNSLISQGIIDRTTKDLDFFFLLINASVNVPEITALIQKEIIAGFGIKRVDIGINGRFNLEQRGFTWVLPKSAYSRATPITKYSNLEVFALHPHDIIILKTDRLNAQDQRDIYSVFGATKPTPERLTAIFEEYYGLLEGEKSAHERIKNNFYQGILTFLTLFDMR